MELLLKEESGDIEPSDIELRKAAEDKVERLEVYIDKFGSFLKELKIKLEIGKAGFERAKSDVFKLNELFGQDKDAKPKELFGLFTDFAR
jgi:hypothetical protein